MNSFKRNIITSLIMGLFFPVTSMAEADAGGGAAEGKKKFCDKDWDSDTQVGYFAFGNGTTLEIDAKKLTEEMRIDLMMHGISQKVGDSYAGKTKSNDFAGGISAAQSVIDQLYAGEWKAAPGEGEGRPRLAELAEAIAKLKNAPLEKAMAAVEAADDAMRKAWRSNPEVKHAIQVIRLEKAQKALADAQAAGATTLQVNLG